LVAGAPLNWFEGGGVTSKDIITNPIPYRPQIKYPGSPEEKQGLIDRNPEPAPSSIPREPEPAPSSIPRPKRPIPSPRFRHPKPEPIPDEDMVDIPINEEEKLPLISRRPPTSDQGLRRRMPDIKPKPEPIPEEPKIHTDESGLPEIKYPLPIPIPRIDPQYDSKIRDLKDPNTKPGDSVPDSDMGETKDSYITDKNLDTIVNSIPQTIPSTFINKDEDFQYKPRSRLTRRFANTKVTQNNVRLVRQANALHNYENNYFNTSF
jgi:hypothetical protein